MCPGEGHGAPPLFVPKRCVMALQNRLQGLFSIKGGGGVPLYMVCGAGYWVLNIPRGYRVLGIKCPPWVCEQIVGHKGVGTNKSG